MHSLRSSSVCVLPRFFFRCARIKLLYIDINGIASYHIAYKEYIDISYKLDIPLSPSWLWYAEAVPADDVGRMHRACLWDMQEQRKQSFITLAKENQSLFGLYTNPLFVLLIRDRRFVLFSLRARN